MSCCVASTLNTLRPQGSPGAYYHVPGTGDGVNKWYVHHQGGGWCESMDDCLSRSKGTLGSSTKYPAEANIDGGYFASDPKVNPLMATWNKVRPFSDNNEIDA